MADVQRVLDEVGQGDQSSRWVCSTVPAVGRDCLGLGSGGKQVLGCDMWAHMWFVALKSRSSMCFDPGVN